MPFEYQHTCPAIDYGIKNIKQHIEDQLDDIVSDLSPRFYDCSEEKNKFIAEYRDSIYEGIEHEFESIRETNSDMRKAAEDQIAALED